MSQTTTGFRLTGDRREKLQALADQLQTSKNDIVNRLIDNAQIKLVRQPQPVAKLTQIEYSQ